MPFAIAPVTTYPPGALPAFPLYIEWRKAGIAQGDRGVRVIDFVGSGVIATRGVGENSNVITVRMSPSPSGSPWNSANDLGSWTFASSDYVAGLGSPPPP